MAAKLLLDENLAPRLVQDVADLFPNSRHVGDERLLRADDETIWNHAAAGGFAILTKDDDFRQRSL